MYQNFPYNRPLDMSFIHQIQQGLPTSFVESLIKRKTLTRQELFTFIPHSYLGTPFEREPLKS